MHQTAMEHGKRFFDTYVQNDAAVRIVDIGAVDVNGSLREVAPPLCDYVGVDFDNGKGVDVVITDPYVLPFDDGTFDVCVSSSCFEHSEFFWLSYLEILRILKPTGVLYVNVPSNGVFHRYPVDCWRFYPDSGVALQNWARRNGYQAELLESYTGARKPLWNDFVAVIARDAAHADRFPRRIVDTFKDFTNGRIAGSDELLNYTSKPEYMRAPAPPPPTIGKAARSLAGAIRRSFRS